jgi:hypothetical protein
LTYRLNQVPDNNYVAFLNLLGITRDPPEPATAFLTFTATPNPVLVAKGRQAQTAGSETEAPIVFETDEPGTILPVNLKVVVQIKKQLANNYTNVSTAFTVPPARGETAGVPVGQSTVSGLRHRDGAASEPAHSHVPTGASGRRDDHVALLAGRAGAGGVAGDCGDAHAGRNRQPAARRIRRAERAERLGGAGAAHMGNGGAGLARRYGHEFVLLDRSAHRQPLHSLPADRVQLDSLQCA